MSPLQIALLIFATCAAALIAVILAVVVRWNARLWLPAHIRSARKRRELSRRSRLTHVLFAVADHFEPVPQRATAWRRSAGPWQTG